MVRSALAWLLIVSGTGCDTLKKAVAEPVSAILLEVHYAPQENLEAIDHTLFQSARQSIDLAAYTLTDEYLAHDLVQAADRGVRVRIYLDKGQANAELSREARYLPGSTIPESSEGRPSRRVIAMLAGHGNIEVRIKRSGTLMHLKSYVVDHAVLRSGSANFSATGEKRQDNDLTLTRDAESIRRFREKFETVWIRPDNLSLTSEPQPGQ